MGFHNDISFFSAGNLKVNSLTTLEVDVRDAKIDGNFTVMSGWCASIRSLSLFNELINVILKQSKTQRSSSSPFLSSGVEMQCSGVYIFQCIYLISSITAYMHTCPRTRQYVTLIV